MSDASVQEQRLAALESRIARLESAQGSGDTTTSTAPAAQPETEVPAPPAPGENVGTIRHADGSQETVTAAEIALLKQYRALLTQ